MISPISKEAPSNNASNCRALLMVRLTKNLQYRLDSHLSEKSSQKNLSRQSEISVKTCI